MKRKRRYLEKRGGVSPVSDVGPPVEAPPKPERLSDRVRAAEDAWDALGPDLQREILQRMGRLR